VGEDTDAEADQLLVGELAGVHGRGAEAPRGGGPGQRYVEQAAARSRRREHAVRQPGQPTSIQPTSVRPTSVRPTTRRPGTGKPAGGLIGGEVDPADQLEVDRVGQWAQVRGISLFGRR